MVIKGCRPSSNDLKVNISSREEYGIHNLRAQKANNIWQHDLIRKRNFSPVWCEWLVPKCAVNFTGCLAGTSPCSCIPQRQIFVTDFTSSHKGFFHRAGHVMLQKKTKARVNKQKVMPSSLLPKLGSRLSVQTLAYSSTAAIYGQVVINLHSIKF